MRILKASGYATSSAGRPVETMNSTATSGLGGDVHIGDIEKSIELCMKVCGRTKGSPPSSISKGRRLLKDPAVISDITTGLVTIFHHTILCYISLVLGLKAKALLTGDSCCFVLSRSFLFLSCL